MDLISIYWGFGLRGGGESHCLFSERGASRPRIENRKFFFLRPRQISGWEVLLSFSSSSYMTDKSLMATTDSILRVQLKN